jgi:hypothetical protein
MSLIPLTLSLPLFRPLGFVHLCRGLIRLGPQAHPFGSPHLCRTASRWLHSQHAPFAPLKLARLPAYSLLPSSLYVDHSHRPVLAPATLAALPSTRAIPDRDVFYVADPVSSIDALAPARLICYPHRLDRPSRTCPRLGSPKSQLISVRQRRISLAKEEQVNENA